MSVFDDLDALQSDAEPLVAELARSLAAAGRWHELFEARLVQHRLRLGLPPTGDDVLEDLEDPLRSQLEDAYSNACSEVGRLLLHAGRYRDAWTYLRPAGENRTMREGLAAVVPREENIEELIEVALYQQADVERGYAWLLSHYGTCNAITTLEGIAPQLRIPQLRAVAATLVRHLHEQLRANLASHIEQQAGAPPRSRSLVEWLEEYPWLTGSEGAHVDASHLAATVRYARVLENRDVVRLAHELAEYGRRLHQSLHYPGEAPFADNYHSHGLLFAATLGERVDEAVDYFRSEAAASSTVETTAPVETYLIVLTRTGQHGRALEAYRELVPASVTLSPFAPSLLELAPRSGEWEAYDRIVRERDDPLAFVLGKLVAAKGDRGRATPGAGATAR